MAAFRSIIAAGMIAAALAGGSAQATPAAGGDVYFNLSSSWNGALPTSATPWMTATFHTVSTGVVTMTLVASLETASEFIDSFAFNVSPDSITPSNLSISASPNVNPTLTSVQATTQGAQSLNGAGVGGTGFDVLLNWSSVGSNGGIARFNGTDTVTVAITDLTDGITAQSFLSRNTGGMNGYAAAHIQGISDGEGGTTSGVIYAANVPVSEPATLSLFAAGLMGIGYLRRRLGAAPAI